MKWGRRNRDKALLGLYFIEIPWGFSAPCWVLPEGIEVFRMRGVEWRELKRNSVLWSGNCESEGC